MTPALRAARAALLDCVRPFMADPAAEPTVAQMRYAVRRRHQRDLELAAIVDEEAVEWLRLGRRGAMRKMEECRRLHRDLDRIHAAEREAWGIDPESDMFEGIFERPSQAEMIAITMAAVREAVGMVKAMEAAACAADAAKPAAVAPQHSAGLDATLQSAGHAAVVPNASPHTGQSAADRADAAAEGDEERGHARISSPFGANFCPRPRPDAGRAAAMARFTRDNPLVPVPPDLFVSGRFGGGVRVLDPLRHMQEVGRRQSSFLPAPDTFGSD